MNLLDALRISQPVQVALVGAGGKTTALFQLARQLPTPVLVTTSTHLGAWQAALADQHFIITRPEEIVEYVGKVEGVTLLSGPPRDDGRLEGLSVDLLDATNVHAQQLNLSVLVEADGSRQRPLKAPDEHEPVIPEWVRHVIVVAGLSAVGKSLTDDHVHRSARFSELSGLPQGEPVTLEALGRVLTHLKGGLKGVPARSLRILLLNQIDDPGHFPGIETFARRVCSDFDRVVLAALEHHLIWRSMSPTAGVVLAAGGSTRMGEPKLLLTWRGKPLIRHTVENALNSGLSPVIVVLGASADSVQQALEGLPLQFVENPDWAAGQSTSVKAAVRALPEKTGAALFLPGDQPFAGSDLIHALLDGHETSLPAIVAPRVEGKRTSPVLFDRVTFPELLALEGDQGGRSLFDRYTPEYVDWHDQRLLLDVDTQADYQQLLSFDREDEGVDAD